MTNYYKTSADYHDDLDRFEARTRAEEAEREYDESRRVFTIDDYPEEQLCVCLEYIGDNGWCPVHGAPTIEEEGSDTSASAQLNDAGFGTGGVL